MIEYVVLGDYETAVGHLLASTPEKSARYYRDALCTLALAVRPRPDRPLRVFAAKAAVLYSATDAVVPSM